MRIVVSDIRWDTSVDDIDDMSKEQLAKHKRAIKRLPNEVVIDLDDECAGDDFVEIVAAAIDRVSDVTGWLVQDSSVFMLPGSAPTGFEVDAFNQYCSR